MSNRFFNRAFSAFAGIVARASAVRSEYDAIEVGFDGAAGELDALNTEVQAARDGQASVLANIQRYIRAAAGLTADLAANGFKVTGLGAPAAAGDAATKAYVDATAFSGALPGQAGHAGKVVRTDGVSAAWGDAHGPTTRLTGAATLVARTRYHVDSSGGAFSLTLPAAPAADDWIELVDVGGACATNNVTLGRNGQLVMGLAENLGVNLNNAALRLVFDSVKGWVLG